MSSNAPVDKSAFLITIEAVQNQNTKFEIHTPNAPPNTPMIEEDVLNSDYIIGSLPDKKLNNVPTISIKSKIKSRHQRNNSQ